MYFYCEASFMFLYIYCEASFMFFCNFTAKPHRCFLRFYCEASFMFLRFYCEASFMFFDDLLRSLIDVFLMNYCEASSMHGCVVVPAWLHRGTRHGCTVVPGVVQEWWYRTRPSTRTPPYQVPYPPSSWCTRRHPCPQRSLADSRRSPGYLFKRGQGTRTH